MQMRRHRCRATWVGELTRGESDLFCPFRTKFVLGCNLTFAPEATGDCLFLPCFDEYEYLPHRTRLLCKWALEHNFDGLWKMDDDNRVDVRRFLKHSEPCVDYLGFPMIDRAYHGKQHNGCRANSIDIANCRDELYASGPCYYLSKRSMEVVANSNILTGPEDLLVGKVLAEAGIYLTPEERLIHVLAQPGHNPGPHNDWIVSSPVSRDDS